MSPRPCTQGCTKAFRATIQCHLAMLCSALLLSTSQSSVLGCEQFAGAPRRTPTSSNARSRAQGWAGTPGCRLGPCCCIPASAKEGSEKGSRKGSITSASSGRQKRASQESRAGRYFYGLFRGARRGGKRKHVGKSTLAAPLLLVQGLHPGCRIPTGPQSFVSTRLPSKVPLEKQKAFPDPECPSSCRGTGISTSKWMLRK